MELHPQAIELLEVMKREGEISSGELERSGRFANVMRPAQWLEEKSLIEIEEEENEFHVLTGEGERVLEEGLPEQMVLDRVHGGKNSVEGIEDLGDVAEPGIGKAMEKGLVTIDGGIIELTPEGEEMLEREHDEMEALRALDSGDEVDHEILEELEDRGLVEREVEVSRTLRITEDGRNIDVSDIEESFNVEAESGDALVGRKHFAREVYDYIRRIWVEMGFREMRGPLVVPSLLNFDALYTPQDHPARELHDTFFMEEPERSDISQYGSTVEWIESTHENGWETGSEGWRYEWERGEAERNVLRTHTTAVSAQKLWELNEEDLPAKYFSLGRNFRNETVDWKHLAEFNQSEGIVVSHDVNFRHLLGYLKEFFQSLGYGDVRFRPSYYPYTELSVEVDVYDEGQEEWVGLGGAGMFRPEVVKPLMGFEVPVLAWGLGPGRIIMRHHGLTDLRDMYRNDLEFMRNARGWMK